MTALVEVRELFGVFGARRGATRPATVPARRRAGVTALHSRATGVPASTIMRRVSLRAHDLDMRVPGRGSNSSSAAVRPTSQRRRPPRCRPRAAACPTAARPPPRGSAAPRPSSPMNRPVAEGDATARRRPAEPRNRAAPARCRCAAMSASRGKRHDMRHATPTARPRRSTVRRLRRLRQVRRSRLAAEVPASRRRASAPRRHQLTAARLQRRPGHALSRRCGTQRPTFRSRHEASRDSNGDGRRAGLSAKRTDSRLIRPTSSIMPASRSAIR